MNKLKKQEKGITLIALVVTIIVLLILAGVAISLTIGNNGLFTRAENAANTWRKAEANEQTEMKNFEGLYDEKVKNLGLGGNGGGKENSLTKITGNETKNTDTTDREGNRIVVPAGFKVINSEATVNEGIVIEDVSANNEDTVGNQFVWVPCTIDGANGSLKYDRYAFTSDDWDYKQTKLDEKDEDGSYKIQMVNNGNRPYYFHEALLENEKISIEANGGFYIGRYEVGCDEERTSHTAITAPGKVKARLNVYNYVTRDEAKTIAERMYSGKSKLCSSYAWDTTLKFIDGETGTYAVNSEGDNCATNNLENTGCHEVKNIYDMGGNVCEWTTETFSYSPQSCVSRGGNYHTTADYFPAGYRPYGDTDSENQDGLGLRVTFYV